LVPVLALIMLAWEPLLEQDHQQLQDPQQLQDQGTQQQPKEAEQVVELEAT